MPANIELPPGIISVLTIYDVKSFAGRPIDAGILTEQGLMDMDCRPDHNIVVTDAKPINATENRYQYLRQNSLRSHENPAGMAAMARFHPVIDNRKLTIVWEDNHKEAIEIDSIPRQPDPIIVQFHREIDRARGYILHKEANSFVSDRLGHEVMLVEMDPTDLRPVNPQYFPTEATIYGQDAYPYNIGLEESAKRVEEIAGESVPDIKIPLSNYRPQISLKEMPDKSEHLIFTANVVSQKNRVLKAKFVHVKPGVRCTITGISAEGLILPKTQPLASLGRERTWISADGDLEYIFAENAVLLEGNGALIETGDYYVPSSYRFPQLTFGSRIEMQKIQKEIKDLIAGKTASEAAVLISKYKERS